jgi:uncharacterized iron-regulated protein
MPLNPRTALCALAYLQLFAVSSIAETVTTADDIAQRIEGIDVVILGEVHDNPAHHVFQTEVVEAIDPSAIVFEMVTGEEASLVTPDLAADADALAEALGWADSGWPDFSMYYPLFVQAARAAVYGAEVPREIARAAFAEGAASVFPGDAARFGLTDPLDPGEQATREAEQQEAHCNALPEDILPGFVEAQRLRDAALAEAALDALEAHGAPVVIVTGNGHARTDRGVPALLAQAAPEVTVFALGQFESAPEASVPFDAWRVAEPVDRPDPCAAFR